MFPGIFSSQVSTVLRHLLKYASPRQEYRECILQGYPPSLSIRNLFAKPLMRYLISIALVTGLLLLKPSQAQTPEQPFTITVADIDNLRCPPRDSVLARIWSQLNFDPVMQRDRIRETLIAYARLNALQRELAILQKQRTNLSRLYGLYLMKQKQAQVSDEEVLRAEHDLLNKEMAIIGHVFHIQETAISLTDMANIRIDLTPPKGDNNGKKVITQVSHPNRKRSRVQLHQRPQRQSHSVPRAQRRPARK